MGDDAPRDQLLRELDLAVVDLELTGLGHRDRICEIAIVRGRIGRVDARMQALCRPEAPMSPGALAVHGITDTELQGAPRFADIAADVAGMLDGAVLVAHNLPFDLGHLQHEMSLAGRELPEGPALDTLAIARRLFAFPRNALGEICAALGVELEGAHRALADAEATFEVLGRMLDVIDPDGTLTYGELTDLVEALAPRSPLRLRQQRVLRQAWRDRRTVLLEYLSGAEPAAGAVLREVAIWFLRMPRIQGWCHLRSGERIFRLDRMLSVRPGERTYEIPSDAVPRI